MTEEAKVLSAEEIESAQKLIDSPLRSEGLEIYALTLDQVLSAYKASEEAREQAEKSQSMWFRFHATMKLQRDLAVEQAEQQAKTIKRQGVVIKNQLATIREMAEQRAKEQSE